MNDALLSLERANPNALRLARLASIASRIEPELLRALRVELLDGVDVSAEADLWWSPVVEARSSLSIRLTSAAQGELQSQLGSALNSAYEIVQRIHAAEPGLTQLEEELVFSALSDDAARLDIAFQQVLGTLLEDPERADEVASWAVAQLPRLPPLARKSPHFWNILFAAGARGRGSASIDATPSPELLASLPLTPELKVDWLEIETSWADAQLRLRRGKAAAPDSSGVFAPKFEPLLLDVQSDAGRRVIQLPRTGWSEPVTVTGTRLLIRSIGRAHELELVSESTPAALPLVCTVLAAVRVTGFTERVASAYLVGPDILLTSSRIGTEVQPLELRERHQRVGAELVDTHDTVALLRVDSTFHEGEATWLGAMLNEATRQTIASSPLPFGAPERELDPHERFTLVLPEGATVSGTVADNRFNADGALPYSAVGAPVVFEGRIAYQVIAVDGSLAGLAPATDAQTLIAASTPWLELLRLAEAAEGLIARDPEGDELSTLRERCLRAMKEPADNSLVLRLWDSHRPGRRWLALVAITSGPLRDLAHLVEQALADDANLFEREQALLAAEALSLPTPNFESPHPGQQRWIGKLGPLEWKLWPNGSVLGVVFLGGSVSLRKRVLRIASEWSEFASLRFVPGDENRRQVRVAFADQGNWSYQGTDCATVPASDATVSLQVTDRTPEYELRRLVLHEFGHVLGLLNEAQNPNARIAWNAPLVYRELSGAPNHFSKQQVDEAVLGTYLPSPEFEYRAFDPRSVMLNPIQPSHTLDEFHTEGSDKLSESDKAFVRTLYPLPRGVPLLYGETEHVGEGKLQPREAHEFAFGGRGERFEVRVTSGVDMVLRLPDDREMRCSDRLDFQLSFDLDSPGPHLTITPAENFATGDYKVRIVPERQAAPGLRVLKRRLEAAGLPKRAPHQSLIATWHLSRPSSQPRSAAAFELIAEVIRHFDVTILSGIHDKYAVEPVMRALGNEWALAEAEPKDPEENAYAVYHKQRIPRREPLHKQPSVPRMFRSFGVFGFGSVDLQLAVLNENHRAARDAVDDLLNEIPGLHQHAEQPRHQFTVVSAFLDIEGPTSPRLSRLDEGGIQIHPALTRQNNHPALDQLLVYPQARGLTDFAGLVDLYGTSPKSLFPDTDFSDHDAVQQLSLRSPAWMSFLEPL